MCEETLEFTTAPSLKQSQSDQVYVINLIIMVALAAPSKLTLRENLLY